MNLSEQWCGIVGATAGRTRSRSNDQSRNIARIAAKVASPGASRKAATGSRNEAGSASARPGMTSKKLRSATIGAMTARMPISA